MSENDILSDKPASVALTVDNDARHLVRLIQCRQCAKPFQNPITLPCGNSLCRACLPESHQRGNITYPDLPGRREGFRCPFEGCLLEHPVSDCSIDVVVAKVLDAVGEVFATYQSVTANLTTSVIVHSRGPIDEKLPVQQLEGSRLLATYSLAAAGKLPYDADVEFVPSGEDETASDAQDGELWSSLVDCLQREVDCQICYNTMLDPVTTYCGHTHCRRCLVRVLDHSQHCPVCRRALAIPPSLFRQPGNKVLVDLLDTLVPDIIAARRDTVHAEERVGDGQTNVPLFVCTLGFPHQPTFLRIFEPRYRLMLRRCMEGNRQFGMLMYNRYGEPQGDLGSVHFYQYGTMLDIIHSQLLPDGTSLLETRGLYRFRVTAHRTLDGYSIGDVERVDDVSLVEEERIEAEETSIPVAPDEPPASQLSRLPTRNLLALSRDFITRNQERSATWLQQRVLDVNGQPPEDAALFPYWFASVLPISDEEKYKLLPVRTVRERLKITAAWILRIESQR